MAWKPSTVEDIEDWLAGRYVPNPTQEEFDRALRERLRNNPNVPRICLVPHDHPSRREN